MKKILNKVDTVAALKRRDWHKRVDRRMIAKWLQDDLDINTLRLKQAIKTLRLQCGIIKHGKGKK